MEWSQRWSFLLAVKLPVIIHNLGTSALADGISAP
jgi:hypothetical protein